MSAGTLFLSAFSAICQCVLHVLLLLSKNTHSHEHLEDSCISFAIILYVNDLWCSIFPSKSVIQ
jgi:hypothetical protein